MMVRNFYGRTFIEMNPRLLLLLFSMLLLSACGGGGGDSKVTPPGVVITYAIDNSTNTTLQGLQFSSYLPAGVDVPLEPGTHSIKSTNLVAGSALSGLQVQTFGTYSAPIRKLKFVVMPTDMTSLQTGFVEGNILTFNCSKTSGATLTVANFTSAHSGVPITELVAYKYLGNQQIENVSSSLTPSLNVTLN